MSFPDYAIGVILIIVGSLGNNLGNNLVSLAHEQKRETVKNEARIKRAISKCEAKENSEPLKIAESESAKTQAVSITGNESQKPKHGDYRVIGTIIFILGNLFTFGSFGFGAQSLLASLESIQFVSNLFFAKYVHNEVVSNRMLVATLSIVGGNVMVVIFADHEAVLLTSNQMIHEYVTNTIYQGYMIAAGIVFAITHYTYSHYYHSRVILRRPLLWNHSFMEPFCYAASSAIIGTQAVLNSKCMAILIQVTITGKQNEFTTWYIYFILGIWLILVAYWLNRLDNGLMMYPPLFIIPVMQVFFVFFAIICGGLYFQEFLEFTVFQFIGFSIGVAMILSGVYGLAPTDMVLKLPAEHCGDEEEEAGGGDLEVGTMKPALSIMATLDAGKSFMHTFSMDTPSSPKAVCFPQKQDDNDDQMNDSSDEDDEDKPVWEISTKPRATPGSPIRVIPVSPLGRGRSNDRLVFPAADCDMESISSGN